MSADRKIVRAHARGFDMRWLHRVACWVWFVPLFWIAVPTNLSDSVQVWAERWAIVPAWIVMLSAGAYYLHLIFGRFRVSLGAFIALMVLWGNLSGLAFAWAGWVAGVTVLLGLGALLAYGVVWGESIARLREVQSIPARVGLVALGALTWPALTLCVAGMVVTAYIIVRWWIILAVCVGLAIAAVNAIFSRRAHKAARAIRNNHLAQAAAEQSSAQDAV